MDNSTANLNQGISQPVNPQSPPPPVDPGSIYVGQSSKKKLFAIIAGVALIFILIVVAVLFLRKPAAEGNAEITYWGLWEDEAVFNEIISDFEAQNPNIKVNYEKRGDIKEAPGGGGYLPFLQTRIREGEGPDVFRYHTSWLMQLKKDIAPLPGDIAKEINLKDNYFPAVSEDVVSSNALYGVPIGFDTLVLYVNNDLVTEKGYDIPQDWTMFLDTARKLTDIDEVTGEINVSGAALGEYDNVDHAADIISLISVQKGINWYEFAGLGTGSQDEISQKQQAAKVKMIDVLNYYVCFAIQSELCTPVWSSEMPSSKLAFVQGKVAFYFGYSWDLLEIMKANPDNKSFSVHPVPKLEANGSGTAALSGYWVEGVSLKSKAQPQAFKFLEFLSRKENIEKIYKAQVSQRAVGVAYPRKDMVSLLSDHPHLGAVVSQAENAHSSIFYADTFGGGGPASLENSLGDAVRSILKRDKGTSSAVDELANEVKRIFSSYNGQTQQQAK